MNGIGWTEILVVAACALIVVGPKDLPNMLRNIGKFVGKARRMTTEFRREFSKVLYDDDISGLKKTFTDPLKDIRGSIDKDIKKINDEVMAIAPKGDEFEPIADKLKKEVGRKTPAKKPAAKKTAASKSSTVKKAPAKKAPAKKPVAKKPVAKKTAAAKPATATPASAKKPVAKKAPAKKTAGKKPAAKKPAVKKPAATKVTVKEA